MISYQSLLLSTTLLNDYVSPGILFPHLRCTDLQGSSSAMHDVIS